MFSPELKKGSIELLAMALLEEQPRHGYEIGKLIEARSGGRLTFRIPSLYPVLCRMENRGWIRGRWLEKPGERRRCYYRLTKKGHAMLAEQRDNWSEFVASINQIVGIGNA